jgi:hypothetical protein
LKGKLRSLMEKVYGAPQTFKVEGVYIHVPTNEDEYRRFYQIAGVFGTLPNHHSLTISVPTRLIMRDVPLTAKSESELRQLRTDLPYTEIKWEAAIDRVTSAATPRQIERVPAGLSLGRQKRSTVSTSGMVKRSPMLSICSVHSTRPSLILKMTTWVGWDRVAMVRCVCVMFRYLLVGCKLDSTMS